MRGQSFTRRWQSNQNDFAILDKEVGILHKEVGILHKEVPILHKEVASLHKDMGILQKGDRNPSQGGLTRRWQ